MREAFRESVAGEEIDLARTLLLIAAEEYPGLDVAAYLAKLDVLASSVRPRLSGDEGPAGVLAAINGRLYRELGFAGNREHYGDPRNSFLNEALDRRTGIPITLAVIYMEVARRLGFTLVGVNMPFHFLIALGTSGEPLIVDAFDGGRIMEAADVAARLSAIAGRPIVLAPEHFGRASPRMIVRRVLNNLRGIYLQGRDWPRALAVVERMAIVLPSPDVDKHLAWLRRRIQSE